MNSPLSPIGIRYGYVFARIHVDLAWFGFFVQWHINHLRLLNVKAILVEEQQGYYLTQSWRDKGLHAFSEIITPKGNIIA